MKQTTTVVEPPVREPDEIDYLKMALALSGIAIDRFTAELVIDTWAEIEKKKGQFNISDSVQIEWRLRKKYMKITAEASSSINDQTQ